jgi:hypothetical protein
MFFENELIGSASFLRVLFALLIGLAPVAVTLAIKVVLDRRRLAEDKTPAPREWRKTLPSEGALEELAIFLANGIENFRRPRRC